MPSAWPRIGLRPTPRMTHLVRVNVSSRPRPFPDRSTAPKGELTLRLPTNARLT